MKEIIIKGEDLARIPLWKTLGKPKDDEEIVLYQLEDGESFPVDEPVSPIFTEEEDSLLQSVIIEEFGKLQTKLYANEGLGDIEQKNIKCELELLKSMIIKMDK